MHYYLLKKSFKYERFVKILKQLMFEKFYNVHEI